MKNTSNKPLKISFVAPFYMVEKYFSDFLSSFSGLSKVCDFEIVLVNDDPSFSFKNFDLKSKNVRIINLKQNMGVVNARNVGIKNISSATTHIMFIDPDDALYNFDFINEIKKNKESIINFKYADWTKKGVRINKTWTGLTKYNLDNHIWGISFPIRYKHLFAGNINENDDSPIKIRVADKVKIMKSDLVAIKYRLRKASISKKTPSSDKIKRDIDSIYNLVNEGFLDTPNIQAAFFELIISKNFLSREKYVIAFNKLCKISPPYKITIFNGTMYRIVSYKKISSFIERILKGSFFE